MKYFINGKLITKQFLYKLFREQLTMSADYALNIANSLNK